MVQYQAYKVFLLLLDASIFSITVDCVLETANLINIFLSTNRV